MSPTPRLVVPEVQWQKKVTETARLFNWRYAHFRPARTKYGWRTPGEGDPGWLDLVMVRPPRLILAELKGTAVGLTPSQISQPSDGQLEWMWQLAMVGSQVGAPEVYLWRPEDWPQVYLTLARGSVP